MVKTNLNQEIRKDNFTYYTLKYQRSFKIFTVQILLNLMELDGGGRRIIVDNTYNREYLVAFHRINKEENLSLYISHN